MTKQYLAEDNTTALKNTTDSNNVIDSKWKFHSSPIQTVAPALTAQRRRPSDESFQYLAFAALNGMGFSALVGSN
jgi:hypothetical protein